MKGAHSIKRRGRGKKILIAIVLVVVLALAGVLTYSYFNGTSLISLLPEPLRAVLETSDDVVDEQEEDLPEEPYISDAVAAAVASGAYANDLYGFQITIPEGFVAQAEEADGSGVTIVNEAFDITVDVYGENNDEGLDADMILAALWDGSEDSISRAEGDRVIIYQYDDEFEYFYWVYVGPGSINQMTIRYPTQDDNLDELAAAQELMQGFVPGDVSISH